LSLDTKYIDENFGEIDDEAELDNAVTKKTSKSYGYSISVPKSWAGIDTDYEEDLVSYVTSFGTFSINIDTRDISASEYADAIKQYILQNSSDSVLGSRVKTATTQTINGMFFSQIETEAPNAERPYNTLLYIVDRPDKKGVVILSVNLSNAHDTSANRAKISKAVESLTFTSK